jgi:hypothetical protein
MITMDVQGITSSTIGGSTTKAVTAVAATPTATQRHGFSFHDFLSAINPLQYLPVVGAIYRGVTGDVIPDAVRDAGSLLVSGLMGGPIGVATFLATTVAEKVTGIDPEKIILAQFQTAPRPPDPPAEIHAVDPVSPESPGPTQPMRVALTTDQLAAYGIRSDGSGNLKLGDVEGADVLNTMELARLDTAAAAYAANQNMPLTARNG